MLIVSHSHFISTLHMKFHTKNWVKISSLFLYQLYAIIKVHKQMLDLNILKHFMFCMNVFLIWFPDFLFEFKLYIIKDRGDIHRGWFVESVLSSLWNTNTNPTHMIPLTKKRTFLCVVLNVRHSIMSCLFHYIVSLIATRADFIHIWRT